MIRPPLLEYHVCLISQDLFLSFHSADRETVRRVQRLLEARGISTFLDQEQMRPGLPAIPQLETALQSTRAVAVFLGRQIGPWQQREIWMALGRQIEEAKRGASFPVIPVLLPGGDARPGFLSSNSWVDLRSDRLEPEDLDALARAARGEEGEEAGAARIFQEVCPFRGLEPFREEDSAFFFGRDVFVESLEERVESAKLLTVVGSSGSGKSSAVLAGLVPKLRKRRPPQATWEVLDFTPGSDPFTRLARQIVGWLEPEMALTDLVTKAQELGGRLSRGALRLGPYLKEGLDTWGADRLLLVVDQFEEILTQTKVEDRKPFVKALLAAVSEAPVSLVVTLRGDFFGAVCDLDDHLLDLVKKGVCPLGPPRREDLQEAIERPAALAGLLFDPPLLVEKLLDDVGEEPGNLPLLQYALLELWNGRSGNQLMADEKVDFSEAIAARAEKVYAGLSEDQKKEARKILLRLVQTSSSTRGLENTRRRALIDDLGPAAAEVIQAFAAKGVRLLVTDQDEKGHQTVEVAHERLISSWERLQRWLTDDTEFRIWRQRLEPSLEYFRRDGTNLLSGSPLAEAERWLNECREELLSGETELIEQSLEERQLRRAEHVRRARRGWGAAAAGLILALAAGIGFWQAQEQAQSARRSAATNSLAVAVSALDAEKSYESLAHLAQAIRLTPEWEVPRALALNVLQTLPPRPSFLSFGKNWNLSRSPDGHQLSLVSNDGIVRIWGPSSEAVTRTPLLPELLLGKIWFSSDGRRAITASVDGTAQIWDASTGRAIGNVLRSKRILSAAFSADGRLVVTSSFDKAAQIWNAATGKALGAPLLHTDAVCDASFSPDGRQVATASFDGTARLWDASTGLAVGIPLRHEQRVSSVSFSPDNHRLITTSDAGTVQVWDAASGKALGGPLRHERAVLSAAFSPDSRRVVTVSEDNTVRLWDASTGEALGVPFYERGVSKAVFSPDERHVVTVANGGFVRVWDASRPTNGAPLRHTREVISTSFSPDGRHIVTLTADDTAQVWAASTGSAIGAPLRYEHGIIGASFITDGRLMLVEKDGTAHTWNPLTASTVVTLLRPNQRLRSASFSPDGRWVVTRTEDGTVQVRVASTGLSIFLSEHRLYNASFSLDGRRVLTFSFEGRVKVWDITSEVYGGRLLLNKEDWLEAALSPDGHRIAAAMVDGTVRIWDVQTGAPVGSPLSIERRNWSPSFSPDGRWVLTVPHDNTAQIWDAQTGAARGTPFQTMQGIDSASFSPDSRWIVTSSLDGPARIWDAVSGAPISTTLSSSSEPTFSPGGRWLLTSESGTTRLRSLFRGRAEEALYIAELAEVIGGLKMTPNGLRPSQPDVNLAALRQFAREAPLGKPTALSLAHWLFMDPWERPIQPLSKMTVPHYICDALRHKAWQEAYEHFPGHPLLRNGPDGPIPPECAQVQ
jgi:WD40 repeat protein